MTTKSVVDIDIDDSKFQRYVAAFAKYFTDVKQTPAAWAKVAEASASAASGAARMSENSADAASSTEKMAQNTEATATAANKMKTGVGTTADALHKISAENAVLTRNTVNQASAWDRMAQNATKFTSRVIEATRSLLRWGELTGLISGVLGAGGLFGIDRLAINAGNQRRSSLGLGITPGEQKAFEINYGRLVDPGQFLSGVNESLHDVTKRAGLYGAGMTEDDIRGKDSAQVGVELLEHIKKIADQTPDAMMDNVLKARHLDQFIGLQEFQRIKNTPAGEMGQYRSSFNVDQKTLDLTRQQTKAWQDLQVQLERAGSQLTHDLTVRLTQLAPAIEHLSVSFVHLAETVINNPHMESWIAGLAKAIDTFATYLDSPKFAKDIDWVMDKLNEWGTEVIAFFKRIPSAAEIEQDFKPYATAFEKSLEVAKAATKEFTDAITIVVDALTSAAHKIVDPWTKGVPLTADEKKQWNKDHPDNQIPLSSDDSQGPGSATGFDRFKSWLNGGNFGGHMDHPGATRGERNNNPLNLQYVPGQQGALGSDGRFGVYNSPEAGIAQAERQLLLYQDRDHLDTISQLVSKWAPANENDTASYIAQISGETGFKPNQHLDLHDPATSKAIVAAMIARETGKHANAEIVQRGVDQGLGGSAQAKTIPFVPNSGKPSTVSININNATGGNSTVSASQLAVG